MRISVINVRALLTNVLGTIWCSVNAVVPQSEVLQTAIKMAQQLTMNSPDAVYSTKKALVLAQSHSYEDTVQTHTWSHETKQVYNGENIKVCSHRSVAQINDSHAINVELTVSMD